MGQTRRTSRTSRLYPVDTDSAAPRRAICSATDSHSARSPATSVCTCPPVRTAAIGSMPPASRQVLPP